MVVINLFGGPGSGKSTTAAGLFFKMKNDPSIGKVELVTEFAKDLVYSERYKELSKDNQLYITAKQYNRLYRLKDKVDFVITDSPILFSLIYCDEDYFPSFKPLVFELFNSFDNLNILLNRVKPYHSYGRTQTEDEAKKLDLEISSMLTNYSYRYFHINGDFEAPDKIIDTIHCAGY